MRTNRTTYDVIVVGGGPAGLTAAIALAAAGRETAVISRRPPVPDNRTTALLTGSVAALDALGVWRLAAQHAAPLAGIRIVDDTARLIRAPEVMFTAAEIGLEAFGQNIENRHLVAALEARAAGLAHLTRIEAGAQSVAVGDDAATVTLEDGAVLEAPLVVGADGRQSICRAAAGIETESRSYPQAALTVNLAHTRRHDGVSTEFHTQAGPFTLVPLPGRQSSLVCVVEPHEAQRLGALDDAELADEIERRAHSILGRITIASERGIFRLGTQTARAFARNRVVLVGEAAHVIPPIGAQGLNLGLRDAATVADLVADADGDLGAPALLARYDRQRRVDVTSRTMAVDLLNRTLLTDFLPVQGARGFGLYLLDRIGPLRRAVMREGVMPIAAQPRLMRGELP